MHLPSDTTFYYGVVFVCVAAVVLVYYLMDRKLYSIVTDQTKPKEVRAREVVKMLSIFQAFAVANIVFVGLMLLAATIIP